MNYLSIDIGGTKVKSAVINNYGHINNRNLVNTPKTYEGLVSYIEEIFYSNDIDSETIGLSCPGVYSPYSNKIKGSSALEYIVNKDIVSDIETKVNKAKVIIENDGNCALLGEYWKGNYRNCDNMAILVVGSAIGGGAIINNKLVRGSNLNAGEFGYMMLDNNIENSNYHSVGGRCGLKGLISYVNSKGYNVSDGVNLFEKLESDTDLYKLVKYQLKYLALAIINLQYTIDPKVILIGGAISQNNTFMQLLEENINEIISIRKNYTISPKIDSVRKGNDSNLLGIAYKCIALSKNKYM